ncbi:hypothetical protein [Gordonia sp. CNJ-863]|uniref:hypothetical protein n=1 Tax=Gordonia sp. CNJ-863 TaxID=1904963 RepID=UPI00111506FC|nr:hypothetical protein [Gordonia sp. CNJ-863]
MSTLAESIRSEALVEAVRTEVLSLETQWSSGMPPTTPPHKAAKVAAAALGTGASDAAVCRAWRNAWRGSWLPTLDLQHALRCWAAMEAAGSVADQIVAQDGWPTDADRDQAHRDLDAILSDMGDALLRSARTVVSLIGTPAPHMRDLETQIARVAALHGYLAQLRSDDQPAGTLAELADPSLSALGTHASTSR